MRYADSRGRKRQLTPEQANYLDAANLNGGKLDRGWGGLESVRTVRLLEERGLATVRESQSWPRWRVTSVTKLGEEVLERWRERNRP